MTNQRKSRLQLLDTLRGWCLVNMIAYHGLWNLVYLFGVKLDWYRGNPGYIWQQSICWGFILLSGFCWNLGRHHLKRGLLVFGGGLLVSAVTHLLMPASRITFGILTFTGSAMLLMIPLDRVLKKIPAGLGFLASAALFALLKNCNSGELGFESFVICELPRVLYRNMLTAYLGFPMKGFFSSDYFPILPWFFLFAAGYFLHGILHPRGLDRKLFSRGNIPVLNWMGQHSLLIYLLHQPVLYGLCLLYAQLKS